MYILTLNTFSVAKKINYYIILCFIISAGCMHESEDFVENAIDYGSELNASTIKLNEGLSVLQPGAMVNVNDTHLLISDVEEEEVFKVFRLPDLEYLYSWGKKGRGPDEFQFVPVTIVNTESNAVNFYDISRKTLRYYSLSDTAFVGLGEKSFSYEGQQNVFTDITMVTDSLFIADYGNQETNDDFEFIGLKPSSETPLFKVGDYPSEDLTGFERHFADFKTSVSSPDGKKFGYFYLYHNLLKFIDLETKEVREVIINDDDLNDKQIEQGVFQYRTVKWASNDYLYVLGLNENRDVISEKLDEFITSLEIWTWDGDMVFRAKFDRPIHDFTVSEKAGKIIAYSQLNSSELYQYDLPDIINE